MRLLIDIGHPAHVHFFTEPMRRLRRQGHRILVTSRRKDIALTLLEELGVEHEPLSAAGSGLLGFAGELIARDLRLARVVRRFRPDCMAEIGGTFIAHAGLLTGVPSLVFYDTENAVLQNAITYPFASRVLVPRCYRGWTPRRRTLRYAGYHELAYLHPDIFAPDRDRALANGLAPDGETFLIRLVSWKANHDVGERGWSPALLEAVVAALSRRGKVLISSEAPLGGTLASHAYCGRVSEIHHVMAFCRAVIGESATMASEAAVLGVPAVYAARTGRGYTDDQEQRYGLVANVRDLAIAPVLEAIERQLVPPPVHWQGRRARLLAETIDVAGFAADAITGHPKAPAGALPNDGRGADGA
jgi:hypothetical protein